MGIIERLPMRATRGASSADATGGGSTLLRSSGIVADIAPPRKRHCSVRRIAFSMTAMSAWASNGFEMASMAPVC